MRQIVLVALIMLLGCTHYNYPFSVDGLKEQGYQQVGSHPAYKVWAKEIQDEGRRVHLCIAPEPGSGGYVWEATVYVDGQPPLLTGIDCTTSAPLPQGRVSFRTLYKFWR
jgi:hypothetical protein